MTGHTLVVDVPRDWWLSSNQRRHRMAVADRTKWIRQKAKIAARRLPKLGSVTLARAWIGYPSARAADPPNAWPTVKAIIDGLVDAGVLDDDNSHHVPEHSFRRHPDKSPANTYRVTVELQP